MRTGQSAYAVGTAALVLGAVVAVWLLIRNAPDALADLEPPTVPVAAQVDSAMLDYAADAALIATLGEGPTIVATSRTGTVTSVPVAPGDELTSGDTIYEIDGIPIIAYDGDTVLYRSLARGSQGADVAAAQRLLSGITGVPLATDGQFGSETERAVRRFERLLGIERPAGVLDPSWFTPLPDQTFTVDQVRIQPGQPAPSAGDAILTPIPMASSLSLETESRGPAGEYEFVAQGQVVAAERAEDGRWAITDVEAAERLVRQGDSTEAAAGISGRLRLVGGAPGQAIPGAAIITDSDGVTCVALEGSRDVVPVQVEGSSLDGLARIQPTLLGDARVLLNALVLLGEISCPSN